jgi:2'-5' RNA ligase
MKRLFIAIDISENQDVMRIYKDVKMRLSKDKIRWVKPENMHITLKFLGSTPAEKVKDVIKTMENISRKYSSTELVFSRVGIFGSSYKPRVIWIGFEENASLQNLAADLKQAYVPLGYEADRQNFVPHLTLGRISAISSKRYFQTVIDRHRNLQSAPVTVNKIYLYESILRREGPEYKVLKAVDLD